MLSKIIAWTLVIALITTLGFTEVVVAQTPATEAAAVVDNQVTGDCAGKWVGELKATSARGMLIGSGMMVTFRLTQVGETVTGEYDTTGAGSKESRGIKVVGTCKGNILTLSAPSFAYSTIEATIKGASMEGTMLVRSPRASQWTATRR